MNTIAEVLDYKRRLAASFKVPPEELLLTLEELKDIVAETILKNNSTCSAEQLCKLLIDGTFPPRARIAGMRIVQWHPR